MSTLFGVLIKREYELDYEVIELAHRSNSMRWIHPLAPLLPDDLKVVALDNGPQGIETIGDIRKVIDSQ